MAQDNTCGCSRRGILHILDAGSLLLVLVLQGSVLNYYIISHYKSSVNPYFWFIADFVCLFIFAGTFSKSYRHLKLLKENRSLKIRNCRTSNLSSVVVRSSSGSLNGGQRAHTSARKRWGIPADLVGPLPLSYASWLIYALILTGKIAIILKSEIPDKLLPTDTFGPQMLKMTIGLSGVIYFLLVEGHSEFSPGPQVVRSTCSRSVLEILDTIAFMSILLVKETDILEDAVVVLTAINFILPTLPLYALAVSGFGAKPIPLAVSILRDVLHLCLLDIPYLVIRVYFWAAYHQDISMFVLKNLFAIIFVVRTLYPDVAKLLRKWRKGRVVQGTVGIEKHELQNVRNCERQNEIHDGNVEEGCVPEEKQNSVRK